MIETAGQLRGAGGAELFHRSWRPERDAAATVILVHGVAEHIGRYAHVAERLVAAGYAVWAQDHRGHGRSSGHRTYVEYFSQYLIDLETFRLHVLADSPEPTFLLGHSMGGAIALAHVLDHPDAFAGLVLSGPAISPPTDVATPLIWIGRALSKIAPKTGIRAIDGSGVSRDPDVVADYLADPLNHTGKLSARWAAEMYDEMSSFAERVPRMELPVLVAHGSADPIVAVEGTRAVYPLMGSTDKTLEIYEGLYHEIFNEPEQDRVLNDVVTWLDARR